MQDLFFSHVLRKLFSIAEGVNPQAAEEFTLEKFAAKLLETNVISRKSYEYLSQSTPAFENIFSLEFNNVMRQQAMVILIFFPIIFF